MNKTQRKIKKDVKRFFKDLIKRHAAKIRQVVTSKRLAQISKKEYDSVIAICLTHCMHTTTNEIRSKRISSDITHKLFAEAREYYKNNNRTMSLVNPGNTFDVYFSKQHEQYLYRYFTYGDGARNFNNRLKTTFKDITYTETVRHCSKPMSKFPDTIFIGVAKNEELITRHDWKGYAHTRPE